MSTHTIHFAPAGSTTTQAPSIEGIARVVGISDGRVWLEPEQTTSCGHCSSSASCGVSSREAAGIGTVTSRLQARRFSLDNVADLSAFSEGERLIVGVSESALLKASLTAYGLPLMSALTVASVVQGLYSNDLKTLLGMAGGLALGLVAARFNARRLAAKGELAPRFIRRALPDETCGTV